jgi:hypothetical protein
MSLFNSSIPNKYSRIRAHGTPSALEPGVIAKSCQSKNVQPYEAVVVSVDLKELRENGNCLVLAQLPPNCVVISASLNAAATTDGSGSDPVDLAAGQYLLEVHELNDKSGDSKVLIQAGVVAPVVVVVAPDVNQNVNGYPYLVLKGDDNGNDDGLLDVKVVLYCA